MKPFDIEAAKGGKRVVTRDGRNARIVCYDSKSAAPLIGLVENGKYEILCTYKEDGTHAILDDRYDLFIEAETFEGWANVYQVGNTVQIDPELYESAERATEHLYGDTVYCTFAAMEGDEVRHVATVRIEWSE